MRYLCVYFTGYGLGFDVPGSFLFSHGSEYGKNMIISGANMSLWVHIDNKKKYILIQQKVQQIVQ